MNLQRALRSEIDNVRDAYSQAHGCIVDPRSLDYINTWLHNPDPHLPLPDLRIRYREPGLWLPYQCTAAFAASTHKAAATTDATNFAACNSATGLFVALVGIFDAATFSDSSSNTWTGLYTNVAGSSGGTFQMYYCLGPTATSSHTFSYSGSFYSITVFGFTGIDSFDTSNATGASNQPGSVTPSPNHGNSLLVTGYGGGSATSPTVDSPFGGTEVWQDYSVGVNYGSAGAYEIQTSVNSRNPTWSPSASGGATIAVFNGTAAGGGGPVIPVFMNYYRQHRNFMKLPTQRWIH